MTVPLEPPPKPSGRFPIEGQVFHVTPEEYGDAYAQHCLEMYTQFLGFVEHLSARRAATNRFFLALNTAILGAIGYLWHDTTGGRPDLYPFITAFGAFLSYQWARFIGSHRIRFAVDFELLGAIERRLPLGVFSTEWFLLQQASYPKRSFMRIEALVAWVFVGIYIAVGALAVARLVGIGIV